MVENLGSPIAAKMHWSVCRGCKIVLLWFWRKKPQGKVPCSHQVHKKCVYVVLLKPALDTKASQRALASDPLRKTIITLRALQGLVVKQTIVTLWFTNQKGTGENKRTTRVYTSFFALHCELHWTIKQAQYTIPISDSLMRSQLLSCFS